MNSALTKSVASCSEKKIKVVAKTIRSARIFAELLGYQGSRRGLAASPGMFHATALKLQSPLAKQQSLQYFAEQAIGKWGLEFEV
jgi:hypothetical protein